MSDDVMLTAPTVNGSDARDTLPVPTMEEYLAERLAGAKTAILEEIARLTEARNEADATIKTLGALLGPASPVARVIPPTGQGRHAANIRAYIEKVGPRSITVIAFALKIQSASVHSAITPVSGLEKYKGPDGLYWVRLVK